MQMMRIVAELGGWPGGPGVNVIHVASVAHLDPDGDDFANFATELEGVYADLADALAAGVTVTVPQECHVLEVATGGLVGVLHRDEAPVVATGTGNAHLSRASQMLIQEHTGDIRNGRLVRGRVNIGPMGNDLIQADGNIDPATRIAVAAAWNTLCDPLAPRIGIWSRPTTPIAANGQFSDVTSCSVAERPSVLRSRRD